MGGMLLPHHQISPNPLRKTAFAAPFALHKGEWKEHFTLRKLFFLMKFDSAASHSLIQLYDKLKTKKSCEKAEFMHQHLIRNCKLTAHQSVTSSDTEESEYFNTVSRAATELGGTCRWVALLYCSAARFCAPTMRDRQRHQIRGQRGCVARRGQKA